MFRRRTLRENGPRASRRTSPASYVALRIFRRPGLYRDQAARETWRRIPLSVSIQIRKLKGYSCLPFTRKCARSQGTGAHEGVCLKTCIAAAPLLAFGFFVRRPQPRRVPEVRKQLGG